MTVGTVVLTPGASCALDLPAGVALLDLSGESIADPEWTARTSLAVYSAAPAAPLLLVVAGDPCRHAPHLGFAQRAARRSVWGYVLIDPVLPQPGAVADWPDAPVTVVVTAQADDDVRSSALGARLRGWDVIEGRPHDVIAGLCALVAGSST